MWKSLLSLTVLLEVRKKKLPIHCALPAGDPFPCIACFLYASNSRDMPGAWYVPEYKWPMLSFEGLGFSLMYIPSIVMVSFYFEERRALATGQALVHSYDDEQIDRDCLCETSFCNGYFSCSAGVTVCGSGIGTFLFAPLTEYLLSVYDWKGAMTVISALVLHGIIAGALFRPILSRKYPWMRMKSEDWKENTVSCMAKTWLSSRNGCPFLVLFPQMDQTTCLGHFLPNMVTMPCSFFQDVI